MPPGRPFIRYGLSVSGIVARLGWADLPGRVRVAAESALGAAVVADAPQSGGFSPGLASRLVLADGRRVFAKAISAQRNPRSPGLYRREIEVMKALPGLASGAEAPVELRRRGLGHARAGRR